MEERFYVLWGEAGKTFKMTESLRKEIFEKLNVSGIEIWDGFYSFKEMVKTEEIPILSKCISRDHISYSVKDRFYHSIGKGGSDFARLIDNEEIKIVDAVIFPSEDELSCLMKNITDEIGLIPFGGGTSVTDGLRPKNSKKYFISLDLRNINFIELDKENMMVKAGAGVRGPDLEKVLEEQGFTLGHFPESFLHSTIGGWIATNAAGQESNRYGKMRDIVSGIRMISPVGELNQKVFPNESAFFRPMDIVIGSEGAFGVIIDASLKIRKKPEKLSYQSFMFKEFKDGINFLNGLFQEKKVPLVARLSDPVETSLSLKGIEDSFKTKIFKKYLKMRGVENGSILILVNDNGMIKNDERAVSLGSSPSKIWREGRYERPYLYNILLKNGIIADTIETSALWTAIPKLYSEVIESFNLELKKEGLNGIIMCHLSHEYYNGSAVYFTYMFSGNKNRVDSLNKLRNAVMNAILSNGGAISHHHGIGRTFQPFLKDYEGLNYELLKSVKKILDPNDNMNPGLI